MTKKELKKYTVEFMNNETGSNRSKIDSVLGKMLIKYAEVFQKQIAELEHQLTHRNCVDCSNHSSKLKMRTLELEKENAELKDEWQKQVQKATDEGYARTLQTIQLSKAKDIIKNLMVYVPVDLKEYEEAKQFLNEVKK